MLQTKHLSRTDHPKIKHPGTIIVLHLQRSSLYMDNQPKCLTLIFFFIPPAPPLSPPLSPCLSLSSSLLCPPLTSSPVAGLVQQGRAAPRVPKPCSTPPLASPRDAEGLPASLYACDSSAPAACEPRWPENVRRCSSPNSLPEP